MPRRETQSNRAFYLPVGEIHCLFVVSQLILPVQEHVDQPVSALGTPSTCVCVRFEVYAEVEKYSLFSVVSHQKSAQLKTISTDGINHFTVTNARFKVVSPIYHSQAVFASTQSNSPPPGNSFKSPIFQGLLWLRHELQEVVLCTGGYSSRAGYFRAFYLGSFKSTDNTVEKNETYVPIC